MEARRAALLPTPSFHPVLTVPHALNALIFGTTRLLLTLLCRAASQTLLPCGQQHRGGQLGTTMVLQTWDQTLHVHFPLHGLVPAGALAEDGPRWVPTQPRFLFPVQALRIVLRATFLAAFQQAASQGARLFPQASAPLGFPADFPHLLAQLAGQPWGVYAKQPCAGPTPGLDDLGRSLDRVAIGNHRLLDVGDGRGRFTSRHRRQDNQGQTMTLEAPECLRRLLLHVLPHGFQRLRHVGCLANRCKARTLRQCRHLLGQAPEPPPREQPSAVERIRQRTGLDMTQCPHCGYGPLVRSPLPPDRPGPQLRGPPEVPSLDSS